MNISQKTLIIGAALVCMTLLSGCIGTGFSDQVLSIDKTEYYADYSRIDGRKVYEVNKEYFIKAPVLEYESSPSFWGKYFIVFLKIKWDVDFTKTGESQQPLWIKLDEYGKKYICEKYSSWAYLLSDEQAKGDFAENPPVLTSAIIHPVLHSPSPKKCSGFLGSDIMMQTAYLGYSRDWTGYAAMPLLLVTVPVDIATSIVCTTGWCIIFPFVDLYKKIDKCFETSDSSKTTDDKNKK